jgi:hypothetical protein
MSKRLVLCVDGVPHAGIERARTQGKLQLFQPPSRVISPFPAMTNVALKELFGAASPLGYEAFYFDRELNCFSGGIRHYLRHRHRSAHITTYHHFVDYQEPVHFEFLIYVLPQQIFQGDLDRFVTAFQASDAPVFVGYLKSTDGLIHLGGQERLDWALGRLDEVLTNLTEAHKGDLEIIMFSDHGNTMGTGRRLWLKNDLRRLDYQVGSQLQSNRSVVIPEFGLVTFTAIYTSADPAGVANDLAQLDGVEFAVSRQEGSVNVTSRAGRATIRYDPSSRAYRYEPENADPLDLYAAIERLKDRDQLDARGFADERAWFDATADHVFPDVVYRLYQAMGDQVKSRADVLLSLADGVYTGNWFFDGFVQLVATHGSARSGSSTGFLMSTHRTFSPAVRASDVPAYLELTPQH